MSLGEFLKTGNQLFSFEEAYLLADWLNQRKIATLITKYGKENMRVDFTSQPASTVPA